MFITNYNIVQIYSNAKYLNLCKNLELKSKFAHHNMKHKSIKKNTGLP